MPCMCSVCMDGRVDIFASESTLPFDHDDFEAWLVREKFSAETFDAGRWPTLPDDDTYGNVHTKKYGLGEHAMSVLQGKSPQLVWSEMAGRMEHVSKGYIHGYKKMSIPDPRKTYGDAKVDKIRATASDLKSTPITKVADLIVDGRIPGRNSEALFALHRLFRPEALRYGHFQYVPGGWAIPCTHVIGDGTCMREALDRATTILDLQDVGGYVGHFDTGPGHEFNGVDASSFSNLPHGSIAGWYNVFYALQCTERDNEIVVRTVRRFNEMFARYVLEYAATACFGELRHCMSAGSGSFLVSGPHARNEGMERNAAYARALVHDPLTLLDVCATAFDRDAGWAGAIGGKRWRNIARMGDVYRKNGPVVFLDQCASLQHNGGTMFSKEIRCGLGLRDTDEFMRFLNKKFKYEGPLDPASVYNTLGKQFGCGFAVCMQDTPPSSVQTTEALLTYADSIRWVFPKWGRSRRVGVLWTCPQRVASWTAARATATQHWYEEYVRPVIAHLLPTPRLKEKLGTKVKTTPDNGISKTLEAELTPQDWIDYLKTALDESKG